MTYVVTLWALRHNGWQERIMYVGSSHTLARLVAWVTHKLVAIGVDPVIITCKGEAE